MTSSSCFFQPCSLHCPLSHTSSTTLWASTALSCRATAQTTGWWGLCLCTSHSERKRERDIAGMGWFCPFQCAFHSYHRRLCKTTNLFQSTVIRGHTFGRLQHDNSQLLDFLRHCFFHYTNSNLPLCLSVRLTTQYSYVLVPKSNIIFKHWPMI